MVKRGLLLWAGFLTLIAAGMGFGVRTGILTEWERLYGFTKSELGTITGGGLTGFGVVILLASLITDKIGYRAIMLAAFVLHVLSAILTVSATPVYEAMGKDTTYWLLYIAMFMFAIGNGLCETAINPLTATLYPKEKTHYLNILHAGWPAGLVLGGLLGLFFVGEGASITTLRWEIPMLLFLIPTVWYGLIVLKEKFPVSEATAAGVSFAEMMKQFAAPMLLFLLAIHACVGYVELGTDSWITSITETFTGQGFLLFIYTSAVMFVLRFFAGPIVHKINPLGLLCASAALGVCGLLMLGSVKTAVLAWVAVTIYGLGKTFLWPTMLGVVGERFPKGGALTMGAMGGIGMLSAGLLGGPLIGMKQDYAASKYLEEASAPTFERYKAEQENSFWGLISVRGLDGRKAGAVLSDPPGSELTAEYETLKTREDFSEDSDVAKLYGWWESDGAPNAATDGPEVKEARIQGGQWALRVTALVPATMFVCYLILVLYFMSQGGYKPVELDTGGEGGGEG